METIKLTLVKIERIMDKPNKEKYGYIENNTFDGEPSGWTIEGGEDAYNKAMEKWKPKCPECLIEASQEELDMFGGVCEECTEELDW